MRMMLTYELVSFQQSVRILMLMLPLLLLFHLLPSSLSLSLTFLPFEVACSRSHEMFQKLFDSMHAIPLSIFA